MAEVLGVTHQIIMRKYIRLEAANRLKGLAKPYGFYHNNGLLVNSAYLTTRGAKFFLAKWDSELGDTYTLYLIDFEATYREHARQLRANEAAMTRKQAFDFGELTAMVESGKKLTPKQLTYYRGLRYKLLSR
jgi:hypothetical protein